MTPFDSDAIMPPDERRADIMEACASDLPNLARRVRQSKSAEERDVYARALHLLVNDLIRISNELAPDRANQPSDLPVSRLPRTLDSHAKMLLNEMYADSLEGASTELKKLAADIRNSTSADAREAHSRVLRMLADGLNSIARDLAEED